MVQLKTGPLLPEVYLAAESVLGSREQRDRSRLLRRMDEERLKVLPQALKTEQEIALENLEKQQRANRIGEIVDEPSALVDLKTKQETLGQLETLGEHQETDILLDLENKRERNAALKAETKSKWLDVEGRAQSLQMAEWLNSIKKRNLPLYEITEQLRLRNIGTEYLINELSYSPDPETWNKGIDRFNLATGDKLKNVADNLKVRKDISPLEFAQFKRQTVDQARAWQHEYAMDLENAILANDIKKIQEEGKERRKTLIKQSELFPDNFDPKKGMEPLSEAQIQMTIRYLNTQLMQVGTTEDITTGEINWKEGFKTKEERARWWHEQLETNEEIRKHLRGEKSLIDTFEAIGGTEEEENGEKPDKNLRVIRRPDKSGIPSHIPQRYSSYYDPDTGIVTLPRSGNQYRVLENGKLVEVK